VTVGDNNWETNIVFFKLAKTVLVVVVTVTVRYQGFMAAAETILEGMTVRLMQLAKWWLMMVAWLSEWRSCFYIIQNINSICKDLKSARENTKHDCN
jgi:flagellar biosynthesis protein FlhB